MHKVTQLLKSMSFKKWHATVITKGVASANVFNSNNVSNIWGEHCVSTIS